MAILAARPCGKECDTFSHSTRLLAATTLRNVLGTRNLAEILSGREAQLNNHKIRVLLVLAIGPAGHFV